eukprot:SAG25_NODE_2119_length_1927_cov_1.899344_1_plen_110_part_10
MSDTNSAKNKKLAKTLSKVIATGQKKDYLALFKSEHEADIAETLSQLEQSQQQLFFQKINPELGADILEEFDHEAQLELIKTLKTDLSAKYIEEMEPDDAVDLLEDLQEN